MSLVLKVSIFGIGAITLFSMIMMIGNVITKSRYARSWAWLAGSSLFLAALLLVLQMFAPLDTVGTELKQAEAESTPEVGKATFGALSQQATSGASAVEAKQTAPTTNGQSATAGAPTASAADEDEELQFLAGAMEYLKQNKPLPPEFLAMLPDGGQSLVASQAKAAAPAPALSQPLQTQFVAIAKSQGRSNPFTDGTYVPQKPTTGQTGKTVAAAPKPQQAPAAAPTTTAPATPPAGGVPFQPNLDPSQVQPTPAPNPQPTPSPAPGPAPQPKPQPQPQPQPAAPYLFDSGVLKNVLGKSKDAVKAYFKNNQFLGDSGNVSRYLRGSTIVEVTYNGPTASSVVLRFERFTPQGQSMSYYEDYMLGVAGMSKANASSRSAMDVAWNGVYPGASSVSFHIDTNANFGTVRASL